MLEALGSWGRECVQRPSTAEVEHPQSRRLGNRVLCRRTWRPQRVFPQRIPMKSLARLKYALPHLSVFSQPPTVAVETLLAEPVGLGPITLAERQSWAERRTMKGQICQTFSEKSKPTGEFSQTQKNDGLRWVRGNLPVVGGRKRNAKRKKKVADVGDRKTCSSKYREKGRLEAFREMARCAKVRIMGSEREFIGKKGKGAESLRVVSSSSLEHAPGPSDKNIPIII